jgi:hypothetical protein
MSRLYDRVMEHGCRRLNGADVQLVAQSQRDDYMDVIRETILEESGEALPEDQLSRLNTRSIRFLSTYESTLSLSPDDVANATVLSAEEVADYWATLPVGTNILDVVASVAPPFQRMFVESQRRPNDFGFESWGILFEDEGRDAGEDWVVVGSLVGEWSKREPVGPVVRWILPLDQNGMLKRGDEQGYMSVFADRHRIPNVPEDAQMEFTEMFISYLGAALFAVSLLHCKNVALRLVDPPDRLSRKHERKHGRPLTRYHVLEIAPMRRTLDSEGEAQTKGLRHALHICRGHFKTFTEEAPLFGRHVGTYWWPAQVRGSAAHGIVEKDYRVRLDSDGIGQSYRHADEDVEVAPADVRADDPDTSQRGLRAHNYTQNLLAQHVKETGLTPRSPKVGEPDFDLAWKDGETVWVAEVKSTTERTEERQMRLAIGQVIRYRQQLSEDGREVRTMIAVENAPFDESFIELCGKEGIALVWPEVMVLALGTESHSA